MNLHQILEERQSVPVTLVMPSAATNIINTQTMLITHYTIRKAL